MGVLPYLLLFLPTVVSALAFTLRGWAFVLPPLVLFGLVPIADHLVGLDRNNGIAAPRWALRGLPALFVLAQVAVVGLGITTLLGPDWSAPERLGAVLGIGFHSASAILVAHELMHRASRWERALAEVLMLSTCYPHFCIEHVHGHHKHVGTPLDPATSRYGESIYAFLPRTLWGGLRSAWRIEAVRVGAWSPRNRMLHYAVALLWLFAVAGSFGACALAAFVGQAAVAVLMLENINYIEHYGLSRRQILPGRWERVRPEHSWNSAHRVSNWMLVNLARHSDHHANPARPYPELRHFEHVPQMPTGYAGMFLLAWFPPLWFAVMNPRVEAWTRAAPAPA
jgi:alkane 1-monooxygenase